MSLNFPDSPSVSDSFTSGERTWVWNGVTWGNNTNGNIAWGGVSNKPIVDLTGDDIDGGSATAWYTWKDLKIDNSDANVVILDGVYADGGSAVN
jgi:hypothetical protein